MLTQDISCIDKAELEKRYGALEFYLAKDLKMDRESIHKVCHQEPPYRILTWPIKEKIWDIDEILEGISAIYQAQQIRKGPDPTTTNDDDDDE